MIELTQLDMAVSLEATVTPFLWSVLSNAVIATLIGGLAWTGRRIFLRPSLWHVVWVLALIKLFLPPMWPVSKSFLSFEQTASSREIASKTNPMNSQVGVDGLSSEPASLESANLTWVPQEKSQHDASMTSFIGIGRSHFVPILLTVWIFGSAVTLVASVCRIVRFDRLVRRSVPADSSITNDVAELASIVFGSVRQPRLRFVDAVVPPLLWPIGQLPTIVLPSAWWEAATEDQRLTVLMHELIHWRRGDHWTRTLQWIASIVFWWHPLVWIARSELHDLEEQCCDAEVMHRSPSSGRSYASALVSVSQWLDDPTQSDLPTFQPSILAMPMSALTQFESFHRRIEMLPTLRFRPWTCRQLTAILIFAAVPLSIGADGNSQNAAAQDQKTSNNESEHSTLTGVVNDTNGKPIADAQVRVVIPSTDLRFPIDTSKHREFLGKTDATGNFKIVISGIEKATKGSIDVLHRGHRRLVGTLMSGGDPGEVTLQPKDSIKFDVTLTEALYFAGQIVDEEGKPVEGVLVASSLHFEGWAGIERTTSDKEGHFAIHGYEAMFLQNDPALGEITAAIRFQHPRYIDAQLEKLETVDASKRDALRVVMRSGLSIGGVVMRTDGKPASDVVVSITQSDSGQRKAMRTEQNGKFRFDGLDKGTSALRVVDFSRKQKSIEESAITATNTEMLVVLKPVPVPIATTHQVLGMTVVDVTPAIDDAYDLQSKVGVMITDPGKTLDTLAIGELRPGYVFWMVGNEKITNLKEMVANLVREAKSPAIPLGGEGNTSAWKDESGGAMVRVVYTFNNEDSYGTNTQYMRLTAKDIVDLEMLHASLNGGQN